MEKRDKKNADDFEKISEVLRTRLSTHSNRMQVINEEQEEQNIVRKEYNDRSIFQQDDSNNEYLFCEDQPQPSRIKNKPKLHRQTSHAHSEAMYIEPPQQSIPIKRTISRPASDVAQPKKSSKNRYKKSDNVGNQIINQSKMDKIFTMVCEPNRTITVNSLGHALQKFKLQFQVKDIVDMLTLHAKMTHPNVQNEQEEDEEQKLDLSVKMTETQFKDMYKMIRKKSK